MIVAANDTLTAPGKFFANPIWIAAQIQNGKHLGFRFGLPVVNPEGKPMGQHPVKSEVAGMDSLMERETFDVGHD